MTIYVCRRPRAVYLMALAERVIDFVGKIPVSAESYSPFLSKKRV
jgi:hypothetical protein